MMVTRPEITDELIASINGIMIEHPDWGRKKISIRLCEQLEWKLPSGQIKDIACREMLRKLDAAGKIQLPAPIRPFPVSKHGTGRVNPLLEHDTTPIVGELSALCPLRIEAVEGGAGLSEFISLLSQYHYLGFDRTVGENLKYVVRSKDGKLLACLLFGSAALKCRDRDTHIGWDSNQRTNRLKLLTNNTRFLIPPWIIVKHLASHVLSIVSHRLNTDWEQKYGHRIVALETFVERERFRGTCYKAANWECIGQTTGRGRNDRNHKSELPIKDIYIYSLSRNWKQQLTINDLCADEKGASR